MRTGSAEANKKEKPKEEAKVSSTVAQKPASADTPDPSEDANISTLNLSAPLVTTDTGTEQPASSTPVTDSNGDEGKQMKQSKPSPATKLRPSAPIPTRSTLAQSSFSWMLEPDESSPKSTPAKITKSPPAQHKKRPSNNASRERNAFLFGEVTAEQEGRPARDSDEIFGLEPLGKAKSPS